MKLFKLFGVYQVLLVYFVDFVEVLDRKLNSLENGSCGVFEVMDTHVQEELAVAQLLL